MKKLAFALQFWLLLLAGLLTFHTIAQTGDASEIDAIFEEWNSTHLPGGAVAIIKNGEITYAKAFGMASLEYRVPNTTETIFNLASVSKQFTAFGIVLLAQEGKLSLDDDIRKHLPEVPDFGEKITIRHLLNHTSGLRSLHALLGMAGWRGDDRRSNADIMKFMKRQRELNFKPGDEYLYCNTGYMFCAEIIERISGQSYEEWMKTRVFDPLGMNNSFCRRDINEVVPDVATSYYGNAENGYKKAVEYWAYIGSGNMHSTLGDLTKWLNNFREPVLGGQEAINQMQVNGVLNNGEEIRYALGINVFEYRGVKIINHGGSIGGYRSDLTYFPEEDLGIIILSNFSSANPAGKRRALVEILLGDKLQESPSRPPFDRPEKIPTILSSKEKQALAGKYYSEELDVWYTISLSKDEKLQLYQQRLGTFELKASDTDTFESDILSVKIVRGKKGKIAGLRFSNGRARNVWFVRVLQ